MKTLNRHALVAWMYVWETVRECPADEVDKGPKFKRFICDLMDTYPDEYEALSAMMDAYGMLRREKHDE